MRTRRDRRATNSNALIVSPKWDRMLVLGWIAGLNQIHQIGRGGLEIDVAGFEFAEGVTDLLPQISFASAVYITTSYASEISPPFRKFSIPFAS